MTVDVEKDEALEPIETRRHRYGGHWAQGGRWSFLILEHRYSRFTILAGDPDRYDPSGSQHLLAEKLSGLVAACVEAGYEIISADATSAYLRNPHVKRKGARP